MKVVTLAAGLAVGYVLGTRAGREKYEQIAASARKLGGHPTVVQAQEKAKQALNAGTEAVTAKIASVSPDPTPATESSVAPIRTGRRNKAVVAEVPGTGTVTAPLA